MADDPRDDELIDRAERLWEGADDAELAELRGVQERLEADGAAAREAFARQALASGPVEHEDDAIAALLEAMEGSTPIDASARGAAPEQPWRAPGGPMLSWWWIAGAVAAVVLAVLAPTFFPEGSGVGEGLMLDQGAVDRQFAPVGEVETIDAFTWRGGPPVGLTHQVRVWLAPRPSGPPDIVAEVYDAPRWEPDAEQLARINGAPAGIWWEVAEIDPVSLDEVVIGSAASRSR
ncbi:hypothetical protein [Engelhardtia mirabilis]|uniref:Zinc-finger domain-containing protein n=1 Tax=Engelhardtia mirabilis TaxID=2528011 RepID=A0A518BSB7_9BACT|nr:hypothetical protein Pla133_49780 [Planctomycetes bacterium Pla133]QDV04181.1 hypothetical protein Pla86_49760 [Planctomycetes bacterium Pla86]